MPNSKKSLKHKNIKKHFKHRCLERLGHYVNSKELVKKIQHSDIYNEDVKFYKKQSLSRTIWIYNDKTKDRKYKVVYDKIRKEIITIFPYTNRKNEDGIQSRCVQDSPHG